MAGFTHSRVAPKASQFYRLVMVNKKRRGFWEPSVKQFTAGRRL